DRLHRHTIHTTSAGMAHANGSTARLVVGTGATSGVELWRRRYNPNGDGCYLSTAHGVHSAFGAQDLGGRNSTRGQRVA
ncbi:unnamed protein product, partial [Ascophyllum nodosum]